MDTTKTERGFTVTDFRDKSGAKCSLQISSNIAQGGALWMGVDESSTSLQAAVAGQQPYWKQLMTYLPEGAQLIGTRMHLSQEMVAELIPALQYFVKTGSLPEFEADLEQL